MHTTAARGGGRSFIGSLGGAGLYPLLVLFGLNFVDEFDRVGFNALAPEIRDALGIGDSTIVTITTVAVALSVLLTIPIGYLADRHSRIAISVVAALMWVASAVGTGLANIVLILAVARFLGGAGRIVNQSVHPSLLSSYYPARSLPFVNAIHQVANPAAAIVAGPVVGLLASSLGYRPTFFIVSVPTLLLLALALRLRDPGRDQIADSETAQGATSFRAGFRTLRKTPTLPRIWAVAFLYAAGAIPFLTVLSLLFEGVYGIGTSGRGWIQGLFGVGGAIGLLVSAALAKRTFDPPRPERLMWVTAWSLVLFGAGTVVLGLIHSLPLAVVLTALVAVSFYAITPPYLTLVAMITNPAVRSQAYGYSLFFVGLGGLLFGRLVAVVAERVGLETSVVLLGAAALLGGLIAVTIPKLVRADVERAAGP